MILDAGKTPFLDFLSRATDSFGTDIVLGCGEDEETAGDTVLTYETFSGRITDFSYRKVSDSNYIFIITTTIPLTFSGTVYEVGLVKSTLQNPELATGPQNMLSFSDEVETWSAGTHVDARISGRGLQLAPSGSAVTATLASPGFVFEDYDITQDVFKLACDVVSGTISQVEVDFVTNSGTKTISVAPGSGYQVITEPMSNVINSNADLDSINEVTVRANGTGTIVLDGLMADIVNASRAPRQLLFRKVVPPFRRPESGDANVEIHIPVVFGTAVVDGGGGGGAE